MIEGINEWKNKLMNNAIIFKEPKAKYKVKMCSVIMTTLTAPSQSNCE